MAKKVIRITESELRRRIQEISKAQINEYSEGFMGNIVDKFKQEASSQVEMYVRRFKEISKNLENKDITQYSWEQLKNVVDSYMNRDDREWSKGLDKHIDQEVGGYYGDGNEKDGLRNFLRKQEMDRKSEMTPSWKERLGDLGEQLTGTTSPTKFIPGVKNSPSSQQSNPQSKEFLIKVLINHLTNMKTDPKWLPNEVAQTIINDCTNFLNKRDIFK